MDKDMKIEYEGLLSTVKALREELEDNDWDEAIDSINTIGGYLEDLRVVLEDKQEEEREEEREDEE